MGEDNSARKFSEMVTQNLDSEIRELWVPMSDNFEREGPDAVKTYLDAYRDRLEGNVRSLLEQFNRS